MIEGYEHTPTTDRAYALSFHLASRGISPLCEQSSNGGYALVPSFERSLPLLSSSCDLPQFLLATEQICERPTNSRCWDRAKWADNRPRLRAWLLPALDVTSAAGAAATDVFTLQQAVLEMHVRQYRRNVAPRDAGLHNLGFHGSIEGGRLLMQQQHVGTCPARRHKA